MSDVEILDAPLIDWPQTASLTQQKFEREREAFFALKPTLLETHLGLFVAIHQGQMIASGADKMEVVLEALAKAGHVAIYTGLISNQPDPVIRMSSPRLARMGVARMGRPAV